MLVNPLLTSSVLPALSPHSSLLGKPALRPASASEVSRREAVRGLTRRMLRPTLFAVAKPVPVHRSDWRWRGDWSRSHAASKPGTLAPPNVCERERSVRRSRRVGRSRAGDRWSTGPDSGLAIPVPGQPRLATGVAIAWQRAKSSDGRSSARTMAAMQRIVANGPWAHGASPWQCQVRQSVQIVSRSAILVRPPRMRISEEARSDTRFVYGKNCAPSAAAWKVSPFRT